MSKYNKLRTLKQTNDFKVIFVKLYSSVWRPTWCSFVPERYLSITKKHRQSRSRLNNRDSIFVEIKLAMSHAWSCVLKETYCGLDCTVTPW